MDDNKMTYLSVDGMDYLEALGIIRKLEQYIELVEEDLKSYKLYDEVDHTTRLKVSAGISETEITEIPEKVKNLAMAQAFLSFIRRAKSKLDQEVSRVKKMTVEDYCQIMGIELPQRPPKDSSDPKRDPAYLEHINPDECCRYYVLKAQASTLGQIIHKKGSYHKSRQKLLLALTAPISVSGTGADTIVTEIHPAFDYERVDAMFFSLQDKQREIQKKLNSITFNREKVIDQINMDQKNAFSEALEAYNNAMQALHDRYIEYKNQESMRVNALKIRILPIFEKVYNFCRKQ